MITDNPQELFDVVDEQDRVLYPLARGEVHRLGLMHRAVHIFVWNTSGQLLVHKRSATKDEEPLKLNSSCSGHVSAGEDYCTAAIRELFEELRLQAPLEMLHKFPAGPTTANEHSWLFQCVTDSPPTFDANEIESGEYLDPIVLADLVQAKPELFSGPFRTLLTWYLTQFPPTATARLTAAD